MPSTGSNVLPQATIPGVSAPAAVPIVVLVLIVAALHNVGTVVFVPVVGIAGTVETNLITALPAKAGIGGVSWFATTPD
jgi:hypothetical protein